MHFMEACLGGGSMLPPPDSSVFQTYVDGGKMAIRWPKLGKNKPAGVKAPAPGGGSEQGQASSAQRMPFVGALSVGGQLSVFAAILAVMGAIAGYVAYTDNRIATYGTIYISGAGDLRMLSQRIGKATQTALQGNAPAFRELLDARERFTRSLSLLADGGRAVGAPRQVRVLHVQLRHPHAHGGRREDGSAPSTTHDGFQLRPSSRPPGRGRSLSSFSTVPR